MTSRIRVVVVGASGATGSSIVNALLASPEQFEVTALARPSSVGKREYVEFAKQGAIVKPADLDGAVGAITQLLVGVDVVISCMTIMQFTEEMALITASKEAGVGRYVPSFFGPACPPRGVMFLREKKEDMLGHIKRLRVPYTVIDVGWWYQLSLPGLRSGRIRVNADFSTTRIIGDGRAPWALADNRDIGRYVARIVADPRTLNRSVFAYSEVRCQDEVFGVLEKIAGEAVAREHVSAEELLADIAEGQAALSGGRDPDQAALLKLGLAQYRYMLGVRGDNTPENARYLGYLDARELYPDVETTTLESYVEDALAGRVKVAYG